MSVNGQKVLAVLPARGGSKRLPGKNIRTLGGRPLLAYSVLTARACRLIDRVTVSSDDAAILETARRWGAEPITRPAELAGDAAPTVTALQHALLVCEEGGQRYDWVALFQPNVPFRFAEDCDKAIASCAARGADGALTVDELFLKTGHLEPSPISGQSSGAAETSVAPASAENGWFVPDYPPGIRKQDLRPAYRENGVFYVFSGDNIRQGRLFGERTIVLRFPQEQALCNIDYEFDFLLAEAIFEPFGYARRFAEYERALG